MPFHKDYLISVSEDGNRWQNLLTDFIAEKGPQVVIETGVHAGVSTRAILKGLPLGGMLFSVDPMPIWEGDPDHDNDPRWHIQYGLSCDVLPGLFVEMPCDIFIHDSDHNAEAQTFEYELAFQCVRPGGYILSDDYTWGSPPHHAWGKFTQRNKLSWHNVGHCALIQKPFDAPWAQTLEEVIEATKYAQDLAHEAAIAYGHPKRYSAAILQGRE